ncbi:MAG: transglutaminase domain-containing protein [Planctomycetes bacterium]|nr:transglutaminase domain-containing protein [Planctomycetota bacterium]
MSDPTHALSARDAFERAMHAGEVRWDEARQGVVLYDRELIEDDGPGSRAYSTEPWYKLALPEIAQLDAGVLVKKILRLERPAALESRLYLHPTSRDAEVRINGRPVPADGAPLARIVPEELLKAGDNEVVLSGQGVVIVAPRADILANAPDRANRPPRSFKSLDGGKTWQPIDGEYRIRLQRIQYASAGRLVSPVLKLAAANAGEPLVRRCKVRALTLEAAADAPNGTRIAFSVRTGATPLYEEGSWSAWSPAAAQHSIPPAHAYFQWQAELTTSEPASTPVLRQVTVREEAGPEPAPPWSAAVRVDRFHNERVRYSSMPFAYEDPRHPKLVELRTKYKLEEVVRGTASEFEALVRLRDWVSKQWEYNPPVEGKFPGWDAHEILERKIGFCVHYAITYAQCCAALGYQARFLFGQHPGGPDAGGHEVNEVWSNEYNKWVLMDAKENLHHVDPHTREPLSLMEVQERMVRMMYADREIKPDTFSKMPPQDLEIGTCEGLSLEPRKENEPLEQWPPWFRWFQVRYMPRNDWYTRPRPLPYEQGFTWDWTDYWVWEPPRIPRLHQYRRYTSRKADLDWSLHQVCFDAELTDEPGVVRVKMCTVTPNFECFAVDLDGGGWRKEDAVFLWKLHTGANRIEMAARNCMGREGRPSFLELTWNV